MPAAAEGPTIWTGRISDRRTPKLRDASSASPRPLPGLIIGLRVACRKTQPLPAQSLLRSLSLTTRSCGSRTLSMAVLRLAAGVRKRVDDLELATGRRAQRAAEEAYGFAGVN